MAKFTKALRQQIVRDFALRHGGFNAALFVEEVRAAGPDHPAYEWFQWDDDKAASEYRIWQAREFARGIKVRASIEEISRTGIRVREIEMPLIISPVDGRRDGGGYFLSDPNDPEHMAEFCRQAAADLERWLRRYSGAVAYAKGSTAAIERQVRALYAAVPEDMDEAA